MQDHIVVAAGINVIAAILATDLIGKALLHFFSLGTSDVHIQMAGMILLTEDIRPNNKASAEGTNIFL